MKRFLVRPLVLPWLLLLTPLQAAGEVFDGLVQPVREVLLSSPVHSFIVEQTVGEGDEVTEGQMLARLYDRPEVLEMQRTEAALEKREFENRGAQRLFAERLISEDEALARRIELDLTRLQHEIAREAVTRRTIKSPLSGVVVERHHEVGEMVTVGEPLLLVVDLSSVFVQIFVTVGEAERLPLGQRMEVRFPELSGDPVMAGEVVFIDPRVDPASGLKRLRILVPNEERLAKPGLRARVRIVEEEA